MPRVVGVCLTCDTRWQSERLCHCGTCHQSFTGYRHFDAHLRKPDLACKNPTRMGLIQNANGVWGQPEDSSDADDEGADT